GENYRTMSCSSGCSSNSNDRACCNNGNDCVYSGTCYSQGSLCAPWNSDAIGSCSSSTWSQTENCATKASENSGDAGNAPTVYGSCIDYITCEPSGPSCTSSTYNDVCVSGTQLTEYYASGASCLSATYTCPDFEVAATGDIANDPTTTGTCTAGTAAGCSSEAFSTAAGTGSGTEGCVDSNECFSNGGAGGGNCIFTEYYAVDSGDACTGLDSCASTTYDPDTNSNTCNECAGSNRFGIGGEDCNGAAAGDCSTQCCGDDSGENKRTCQDGGAGACTESTDDEACCSDSNACVYDGVCYSHDEATGGWACNQGTWERLEVIVVVIATPDSVKTVWQNTDATASIDCTPHPSTECDPNSYRLRIYTTTTSTCSTDYDTYSTPGTQTISSHSWVCGAAKDNYGTEGFSDSVEFRVDQINPTASLDSLPAWTTQSSVTVDWSGSDTGGSGINQFELEYRVTMVDGSVVQDWADWTTSSSNPGTLPFSDMQNNRTYHFRIRATDNAGNTGDWSSVESIGVDMVDPTCQVGDLPIYTTSSSFIVSWSGSDGESGIQYYNIQVRVGESGTWGYLNDPDGYHTTETWDNVNGADGNTYFFRCNATDVAGNEGAWSAVKNTTVDATDPISSVDPLPEWLNVTNFTVSWSGNDGGGSGIDCYDINWSDGSGWNDWFACTQITSSMFGPDSPVSVTEGVTYSFSSRARDVAGNVEEWPPQPDAYTTIDLTPPQYDLRAYDQDG
ncbi:MAG: fibronectin type III domain-containing protein, partial [Candidatus Aenigmarchaeota archaeon]|nr:fibronectin type III domain-containing protein [Candidatus Aenigmarchaeota archaeon]